MNLARLKKNNNNFEVCVNPEKAMDFKKGKCSIDDVLEFPKIFSDVKKGMKASEESMKKVFGTIDVKEIAKKIVLEGEVQLTSDYRKKLQEQKKKQIIDFIHKQSVDPKTNIPHPLTRIEAAFEEAKINIDSFKSVEEQIKQVLPKLQRVLPIKFVVKEIDVVIPGEHVGKAYNKVKSFGKIIKEDWRSDGSWHLLIEIPGGLEQEFYDKLNNLTRGSAEAMVKAIK